MTQRYDLAVLPWSPLAGGWLSGRHRRGEQQPVSIRAARLPGRFDLHSEVNASKLEAAFQLAELADEAGIALVDLALAFVLEHPGVTSAIIGPRTMQQLESQLGAVEVRLTDDVLDRIDEIVPPGVTLNAADTGYVPIGLSDPRRRRGGRRELGERPAYPEHRRASPTVSLTTVPAPGTHARTVACPRR